MDTVYPHRASGNSIDRTNPSQLNRGAPLSGMPAYCRERTLAFFFFVSLLSPISIQQALAAGSPTNVIVVTVDTLRADRLGCYGNRDGLTPVMDRLSNDGALFQHAVAQVPLTLPSHTAILTGSYPIWNGVQDLSSNGLSSGVGTLAEMFKERGYYTGAFVSAFVLNSMWGLNRGFDYYDDDLRADAASASDRPAQERRAAQTVERSLRWLEARRSRPFFLWVHLYDPHAPYEPPEPFKSRFRGHPYDGEVAYSDQQLGRLVDFLKTHHLYASSLIVLVSDHGEGLGDHQEQQHGLFIYNSTVHVPLILKPPDSFHLGRRSVAQVVNTVDIAPTIAQFAGLPSQEWSSFQGRSLLPLLKSQAPGSPRDGYSESLYPRTSFGWHSLHGIQTERYHYIDAPREELYDLTSDPGELRNLMGEKPTVAASMRETLRALVARYNRPGGPAPNTNPLDLEKLRELRSLGYIGASTAEPLRGDPPGAADPKDRVEFYNLIVRATELAEDGRRRESNALLEKATAESPDAYLPLFLLGENALAENRFSDAMNYYRKSLERNPRFDQAAMGLGQAALRSGDAEGAGKAFRWALELNPHNFVVRLALARAYEKLNRLPEALEEEKRVLLAHPKAAQAHAEYGVTLVRMKRYGEALPVLLKARELGDQNPVASNFLGTTYLALGKPAEAVRAYEEAIRLDAKYSAPYGNLALFFAQAGEREKALSYYRQACQLDAPLCRQLEPRFK